VIVDIQKEGEASGLYYDDIFDTINMLNQMFDDYDYGEYKIIAGEGGVKGDVVLHIFEDIVVTGNPEYHRMKAESFSAESCTCNDMFGSLCPQCNYDSDREGGVCPKGCTVDLAGSVRPQEMEIYTECKIHGQKLGAESFNAESHAYSYAYNEGHSDSRKREEYRPNLSSARQEGDFKKILKQKGD